MICVFVSGLTPDLPTPYLLAKQALLFNIIVRLAIAGGHGGSLDIRHAKAIAARVVTRFYDVNSKAHILCVGVGDSKLDGSLHCTISRFNYRKLIDYYDNENVENGYPTINFGGFDTECVSEVIRLLLADYMTKPAADTNLIRDIQNLRICSLGNIKPTGIPDMITVSISGLPAGAMTDQSLTYPKCSILFSCLVQLAIATGADKPLDLTFPKRAFSKFVDTFYGARTNPLILKAGIDGSKLDGDYHCTFSLDTYNELIASNGDNYISITFSTFDVASTREFVRRVMATHMQGTTVDGGLVQDIQHWCLGNERMNALPLDIVDTPLGGQPSVDFMLSKTGREWGVITETGDSGVQVPITKPPAQVLLDFTRSYDHVYNGDRIFIATSLDATTRAFTATETDRLLKIVRQVLDFAGSPTADINPVLQAIVPNNVNQAVVNTLLANGFNVRMIAERFTDHLSIVIVAAPNGTVSIQVAGWPRTKVTLDAKTLNNVRVLRDVAHDFDVALSREVLTDPEFNIEQVFQSTGTLSIEMTPLLRILPRVREYEWVTLV